MRFFKRRRIRADPADSSGGLDARLASYLREAPDRAPAELLGATAQRVRQTPQRRRRWGFGWTMSGWAVVAAVVAIAVIASLRLGTQTDVGVPPTEMPTPVVASIASGREPVVAQRIGTSTIVMDVFVVDGATWAVLVDGLVVRIDLATGELIADLDAQLDQPTDAAAGAGAIWVGSADGDVVKVDVASGAIETEVDVGIGHHAVAASADAVWVAGTAEARRIDAATLAVTTFDLPPGVVDLEAVGGDIWATYPAGRILVVDGRTAAQRATLSAPAASQERAGGIFSAGTGDVWVAETGGGGPVHRIDAVRHEIVASVGFEPPSRPSASASDGGGIWVLFSDDGFVVRVDRESLAVVDVLDVGLGARGIGVLPEGLALWGAGGIRVLDVEART